MSNVQEVFITSEVAEKFKITAPYLIRVAKEMDFSNAEFREAKKHTYLFSVEAVDKLSKKFAGNTKK